MLPLHTSIHPMQYTKRRREPSQVVGLSSHPKRVFSSDPSLHLSLKKRYPATPLPSPSPPSAPAYNPQNVMLEEWRQAERLRWEAHVAKIEMEKEFYLRSLHHLQMATAGGTRSQCYLVS